MVLEPIYLDLSSSDDEDEDHNRGRNGTKGPSALVCFSKVFNMDVDDDDDDDVRIIDKPTSTDKLKSDRARVIRSAIDDDECCILDSDPGATETPDIVSPLDTDELVMTGEKGPVACRDFPHARYLCVHFPFKTTLHINYCAQCHCYVCDSLAPCALWGEGNSPNDHCHASEEPRWKILRKVAKCGSVPAPPVTGAAAQAASTLSNLNGSANPTGVNRLVKTSVLQAPAAKTSPILHSVVKRDPLIIKLKGKSRGRVSQPPQLGVRSSRPHRVASSFPPGHRDPPLLRPTSTPTGKTGDGVPSGRTEDGVPSGRTEDGVPSGRTGDGVPLSTPAEPAQIAPPPESTPYPNPRHGRPRSGTLASVPPHPPHSVHIFNTLPRKAASVAVNPPPEHRSQPPIPNPIVAPCFPALSPPLPPTPPYYTPPPPPPPPLPPPPVSYDHFLQPSGADSTVPDFVLLVPHIPDSRYVSDSALSDFNMAPVNEDNISSQAHAVHRPNIIVSSDYSHRSPVDSAHSVDILLRPIEGWEVDAAAQFDSFAITGIGAVAGPGANDQAANFLDEVLELMAGDDYLWEEYPGW